ncbi:MAG: tetratricopeptide repeat protein [Xanthomonadales bacterium]|nr:tetratricopeptide repeat protein [Xanthomonadales bacterium]
MKPREIRRRSEALVASGEIQQAGRLLEQALALQPFDSDLLIGKANVMLAGRQYRQAIETLRDVIRRRPDAVDAHFLLGNAYRATRMFHEAASSYRAVLERSPTYPGVHHFLGIALQYSDDLPGSAAAYREAIRRKPELALLHFRLGSVLHLLGRHGEAIAAYQEALKREPAHQQALTNLALALIATERDDEAFEVAQRHVREHPGQTMALANLTFSAIATGRDEVVRRLLDFERLFGQWSPTVDDQALGPGLVEVVEAASPLKNTNQNLYTTRKGFITNELKWTANSAFGKLHDLLEHRVSQHLQACTRGDDHPWATHLPERWQIKVWGNVQQSGGYEDPHCHPRAFASGVYYLQVPPEIANEENRPAGWIEIGRGDDSYRYLDPPEKRLIQPSPGLTILFPSYFFHRTFPFESETRRICLPFDVVAASN